MLVCKRAFDLQYLVLLHHMVVKKERNPTAMGIYNHGCSWAVDPTPRHFCSFLQLPYQPWLFCIFLGILLHQFIEEHSISNKLQLCAVTIFISFSLVYLFKGHFISNGFIFLLTLFVYPSIIIICLSPICQKLFRFPILGILGEVSFGMYLWHTPIFQFFTYINSKFDLKIPFHSVSMMIFSAGVITFIGFISFYCIEKPISKYFSSKTLSKTP